MKKKYIFLVAVTLLLFSVLTGCQSKDANISTDTEQQNSTDTTTEQTAPTEEEPTEDPQIALDKEKVAAYLNILGLDETCNYELLDTFPVNDTEKSYLLNIYDISEDSFASILSTLESGGFSLASDIMTDDERKTRSYQYTNSETIYTEMVFSYEAQYINIIFTPIV